MSRREYCQMLRRASFPGHHCGGRLGNLRKRTSADGAAELKLRGWIEVRAGRSSRDGSGGANYKKRKYTGRVLWQRTEVETDAKGMKNRAIRADIDIPEAKLSAQLTIRLNADAALPASHTIEIKFRPQPGFEGGSISTVPGVMMKPTEEVRGTAFAAVPSKIGENDFLIGLSNTETERRSNMQLLSKQSWFDIPAKYADNRSAILALEKGSTGDIVFAATLMEWASTRRQ